MYVDACALFVTAGTEKTQTQVRATAQQFRPRNFFAATQATWPLVIPKNADEPIDFASEMPQRLFISI